MKKKTGPVSVVIGGVLLIGREKNDGAQKIKAVPDIKVEKLLGEEVVPYYEFIGRTKSNNTVTIVPRVDGELTGIFFKDGQDVKKGDLLYEIDPRIYLAKRDAAQAELDEAKANLKMALSNKQRAEKLVSKNLISIEEFETKKTEYSRMLAAYDMAKAHLLQAKLHLDFTKIKSPMSGRMGYSGYKVGDRITVATKNKLVSVTQLSPMLFDFEIDEKLYRQIRRSFENSLAQNESPEISLMLSDNTVMEEKGIISAVDNRINPVTGAIHIQASFPNASHQLLPGEYGKLFVRLKSQKKDGVLVPLNAIQQDQKGSYVYLVDNTHHVATRYVLKGQVSGAKVAIVNGLGAGDKIAVSGLSKLRTGMEIREQQ